MRRRWLIWFAIAALALPLLFAPASMGVTAAPAAPSASQHTALTTMPVLQDIVAVAAGYYHTCAVTADGGVRCWGNNTSAQLGDDTTTERLTPVDVDGLSKVTAVAAGHQHTCALTTDGDVKCWGANHSGQLGDGTTTDRPTPGTVIGLSGKVSAIVAGYEHTCALTTGGGVECWGDNDNGQLGDGTTTDRPTPGTVIGLSGKVSAIVAGVQHTCAVTTGGGVQCWGRNDLGQLGDGTRTRRLTPVTVAGLSSGVSAIAAGYLHTCAVTTGGGAKCWGNNYDGQLGDDTMTERPTPVTVAGLSGEVSAVAAGAQHTCAVTTGGGVQCWGRNDDGQLGDGTKTLHLTAVDVSGLSSGVSAIAAGVEHTCALMAGGGVRCWGDNDYGQLGDGVADYRTTPGTVVDLSGEVSALAAGYYHTCALMTDGRVQCWGYNLYGQLGTGTAAHRLTPVNVSGLTSGVSAIAAGASHTCAVTTGGGAKCWGRNTHGQLGTGTTTHRLTPVNVSGLGSGVSAIAAGASHTCALMVGGGVQCWGYNAAGQLGDGTTTDRLTPVSVVDLSGKVTAIAAGAYHTCALTTGGVQCWGYNGFGQLGDGTTTDRLTPVTVAGLSSGVSTIAAGVEHTCAVTTGGGVQCWGNNTYGQLGDGTDTYRHLTPVGVSGLSGGVTAVAGGHHHTCAVTVGGGVRCWGYNDDGQLGDGTRTHRLTPVNVSGLSSGVTAVAGGHHHTCALTTGGGVRCWGYNADGQLGDGVTGWRTTPGTVVDTGAAPTEYATGRVTLTDGQPLPGVTVAAGAVEAVTDADGIYVATGLVSGTYTLAAAYPGYSFTPTTRSVTLPPAAIGVNFVASMLPTPTLRVIANPDGDGSYTVSWDSVPGATDYTLQEATTNSFFDATTVYSGTATSRAVTGKLPGTYTYRVKATDARGDSAWSAPLPVLVRHRVFLPLSLR